MPTETRSNAARRAASSTCGSTMRLDTSAQLDGRRAAGERPRKPFSEARADALGHELEHILLGSEVDQLFRFHDLARDVFGASQGVGKPELDALLAGPYQAGKEVRR